MGRSGASGRGGSQRRAPPPARLDLHPVLAHVVRRARSAELVARGADRRPAFRLTRQLLSEATRWGVAIDDLAHCMGVDAMTVRTRITDVTGAVTRTQLSDLVAGLDNATAAELLQHATPVVSTATLMRAIEALPLEPGGGRTEGQMTPSS